MHNNGLVCIDSKIPANALSGPILYFTSHHTAPGTHHSTPLPTGLYLSKSTIFLKKSFHVAPAFVCVCHFSKLDACQQLKLSRLPPLLMIRLCLTLGNDDSQGLFFISSVPPEENDHVTCWSKCCLECQKK